MPVIPTFAERLLFLQLNQAPAPLLDIWNAVAFRVTLAAVRLRVFDTLQQAPCSVGELAHQLQMDVHGTAILLETLEVLGYVQNRGEQYANTAMTTKWLISGAAVDFSSYYRYWGALLAENWDDLEETLRTGQPTTNLYEWIEHQPATSQDFQNGMVALAHLIIPELTSKLDLPGDAQRLLDVGGGHALYSIALCRQYPDLTATVFDSPQALQTARESIAAANLYDRITLQPGDFRHDDLGDNYDVALLFNIIHGFTPDVNEALFARVAAALRPGGRIVILEQLAGSTSTGIGHTVSQLLGISYFQLLGGQVYAYPEVIQWLQKAGFIRMYRIKLLRAPGSYLIIGTKVG